MARHIHVSCDSCGIEGFKGKRFKCLICYDYDLCEICFESNATTTPHIPTHPMQCILTRNECELYFGGESNFQLSQSFTCPCCGQKGFSEIELTDHVTSTHGQINTEVICPICCCFPRGRTIPLRDDFINHLNIDHRNPPRDIISFFDENPRRGICRIPVSNSRLPARGRRSNINFSTQNNRENSDRFAEILTHLSGNSRIQGNVSVPTTQPEILQVRGRHIERIVRNTVGVTSQNNTPILSTADQSATSVFSQQTVATPYSQLLLSAYLTPRLSENYQIKKEEDRADRSLFVSRLILNVLKGESNKLEKVKDIL